MRAFVRTVWSTLAVLTMVAALDVRAQNAPPAAPPAAGKTATRPANLDQVLGTVNGEKITRADLLHLVEQYQLKNKDEEIYEDGMEILVNTKLLNQYLKRQNLPVSNEKIDADIENIKKELKANGTDLATMLYQSGNSMEDIRNELAGRERWKEYVRLKATDGELKKFVASHRDLFNGTQVRASHILLQVDPKAPAAEKKKVHDRLAQIKQDIERNKFTFAEAANKFSEDPNKTEGDGGDIGYFTRTSGIIEEFADAAFKLRKGDISNPVETIYGYHLIQATDRKDGQDFDLEAKKPFAASVYAADLQKNIVTAMRKDAKIDIKPMPADLKLHAEPVAPPTATGTTPKAEAPKASNTAK